MEWYQIGDERARSCLPEVGSACLGVARVRRIGLAGIGEAGDDGGNATRRGDFAGVDDDEQLHDHRIDTAASRLQDVDVLVTHVLLDLDGELVVCKLAQLDLSTQPKKGAHLEQHVPFHAASLHGIPAQGLRPAGPQPAGPTAGASGR